MTLVVASCNTDAAIIAADTRLSVKGLMVDDLSAKIGSLVFCDGRLIYAYTGLAKVGKFETRRWILETLRENVSPWTAANDALLALKEKAAIAFRTIPDIKAASLEAKRLTIVFAGYIAPTPDSPRQPVAAILSNFENYAADVRYPTAQDQFWLSCWTSNQARRVWTGCFGSCGGVPLEDISELDRLVEGCAPVDAIKGKSEAMIARASVDPRSNRTVGPKVIRATLSSAPPHGPLVGFSSDQRGDQMLLLDQFNALSPAIVSQVTISAPGIVAPRLAIRRRRKAKKSK